MAWKQVGPFLSFSPLTISWIRLLSAGTALIFLGFLVASEVRDYFGIFLSLSILLGLGSGYLFVPSVAIIAQCVVIPIIFKASLNSFKAFNDLNFTGLYIPFYYVPSYAKADLNVTASLTFGILSVINTGALFKRSLPSLTAKYFSSINILTFVTLTYGIIHFYWIPIYTLIRILIFGAIPDVSNVGTWFSLSYSFTGFGILIGSLIAGILISRFGYRAL
ncbi:MFS general substrate transporter [Diplogelasinospora grovesii]|uniref:MFS general substrate transporter n=1 Tax=Diplogelasinospora grovesii TaxID=303347 RepID=A0AAN6MXF1_9PEZI|nr:MFS general substrate transporter [Diplogelasinospora grovesii]